MVVKSRSVEMQGKNAYRYRGPLQAATSSQKTSATLLPSASTHSTSFPNLGVLRAARARRSSWPAQSFFRISLSCGSVTTPSRKTSCSTAAKQSMAVASPEPWTVILWYRVPPSFQVVALSSVP
jgi:hypothetical protein